MQTLTDLVGPVPQILAEADAFIADRPVISAIIGVIAVALLVLGYRTARAVLRMGKRTPAFLASRISPRPTEDTLTVIAAGIATAVSASGMWQFFERIMPGVDWPWRVAMFAFIEVAVITSAVRAKRSMKDKYSAGVDGMAVWALTSLSAVLSAMEASSFPEGVFRLAAPLVAAWLWERGMAIERHRLTGLAGIHWRITPERILVRLGLAEAKDRTADEVDTHRRLTGVALAAKRARTLREAGASDRKMRTALTKLDRAFEKAAEHTGLASDPKMQERVRNEVGALYSASGLLDVTPASAWTQSDETEGPSDFDRLADETHELNNSLAVREEIRAARDEVRASEANILMLFADKAERHLLTAGSATSGQVADRVAGQVSFGPSADAWWRSAVAVTDTGDATFTATHGDTSAAVAGQVSFVVTDETTDDDMEAIIEALRRDDTATETATASATDAMWRYWQDCIAKGELPTGAKLAEAGGCGESYGRRMRGIWEKRLDAKTRRRLNAAKKVTA